MSNNISPKTLNILKAALPFFPGTMQRNLSYFVKINEFNYMFHDLNNSINATISACEVDDHNENVSFNLSDLLYAIKPYLDKNERDMINMFMNITTALNLYKSFGNNPTSLLNGLLASENNAPIGSMFNNSGFSSENTDDTNDFSNNNFNFNTDTASAINNILQGINTANNNSHYTNNSNSDTNGFGHDMSAVNNSLSHDNTSSVNQDFRNNTSELNSDFTNNSFTNNTSNFNNNSDNSFDNSNWGNNTNYNNQIDASIEALKSLISPNLNEADNRNEF